MWGNRKTGMEISEDMLERVFADALAHKLSTYKKAIDTLDLWRKIDRDRITAIVDYLGIEFKVSPATPEKIVAKKKGKK